MSIGELCKREAVAARPADNLAGQLIAIAGSIRNEQRAERSARP